MYVYLLQSIQFPNQCYIGSTKNIKQRLPLGVQVFKISHRGKKLSSPYIYIWINLIAKVQKPAKKFQIIFR